MEISFHNENEESFRQVTNDFPRVYMQPVIPLMERIAS